MSKQQGIPRKFVWIVGSTRPSRRPPLWLEKGRRQVALVSTWELTTAQLDALIHKAKAGS